MKKILVIDDDEEIRKLIKDFLSKENFEVETAKNGSMAIELVSKEPDKYQLAVLDIMLPDISGVEVCKEIRKFSGIPILMLTAKSEDVDKIIGLEVGADDYLTKPFNPKELVARIKAILRRVALTSHEITDKEGLKKADEKIIIAFITGDLKEKISQGKEKTVEKKSLVSKEFTIKNAGEDKIIKDKNISYLEITPQSRRVFEMVRK
jgi:DNA-binding response OmpR family regulator